MKNTLIISPSFGQSIKHIQNLYGEKVYSDIRRLEQNVEKVDKRTMYFGFCIMLPGYGYHSNVCKGVKHAVASTKMTHILKHTSTAILREWIHINRRLVDDISRKALKLHLKVASSLGNKDWDLVDRILGAWVCALYKKTVKGQKTKFEGLCLKKVIGGAVKGVATVVNPSSKMVYQTMQVVFNKGLNYAIVPTAASFKEIICGVETALKDLSLSDVEEVSGGRWFGCWRQWNSRNQTPQK